ncbi:MAG TPA: MFS transporter [Rhizomicrobium sp.]|nr:MFS transporter [Rhizomicrobium sp.]
MSGVSEVGRRALAKAAWRLVPFLMLLYFISFLDRVNIGFAALTMNKALGLSASVFGLASGLFFLGYFLLEVPSNLVLRRVGARLWITRIMITWSIFSAANAFVSGAASFYVMRFLLGMAEAGFFPGIILYLSYWFPAHKRAAMIGIFMTAAPLSTAIGSPISARLLLMDGLWGLAGWQWVFILEALPALVFGIMVLFFLTDRPEQARWLKDDERAWLVETMRQEREANAGVTAHSVWSGLTDWRVILLSFVYFGTSVGLYVPSIWGPLMFKQFGLSLVAIGNLNLIPGAAAVIVMVLWGWSSDRSGERVWHTAIACLISAAGLFYAGVAGSVMAVLVALTLATVGVNATKGSFWSLPTLYFSGPAAAASIAAINSVGNIGGFVGPYLVGYLKDTTGSYAGGLWFSGATLVLSAVLVLVLKWAQGRSALAQAQAGQ